MVRLKLRVCPKCKYIDPPEWKHTKYSYHIDNISLENFQRLYPHLAKNLKTGGDITEDEDYYYRLVKTKLWVSRKAKIEWTETNPFGAEKYEKFDHKFLKDVHDYRKYWSAVHPNQTKLLE